MWIYQQARDNPDDRQSRNQQNTSCDRHGYRSLLQGKEGSFLASNGTDYDPNESLWGSSFDAIAWAIIQTGSSGARWVGVCPASKVEAEFLLDIIRTAHERTSIIGTTNLPFENWTQVLGSERLWWAVLDRLTHRCHIIEMNGESYRLKDAKRRRKKGHEPTIQSDLAWRAPRGLLRQQMFTQLQYMDTGRKNR